MKSLTAKANSVSQKSSTNTDNLASTEGTIGNSDTTNSSVADVSKTTSNDTTNSISNDDLTVIQETTNDVDSSSDVDDGSWIFDDKNFTRLFEEYQSIIDFLVNKYEALPLESYINELAALTHTFVEQTSIQSHC